MKRALLLISCVLTTSCGGPCTGTTPLAPVAAIRPGGGVCRGGDRPTHLGEEQYASAKRRLGKRREGLARDYRRASGQARRGVLRQARRAVIDGLRRHLMPHWCGTPWAFHGTTEVPGTGSIACGYFVSTLLRDAGFAVERFRLARRPSEAIIKSLTTERLIRRFSDAPIERFVRRVVAMGEGLFVVGLDNHVGFLLVEGVRATFIHSSYLKPYCVVEEEALLSPALVSSRYRVVGKITDDPELIRRWLTGDPIPTR